MRARITFLVLLGAFAFPPATAMAGGWIPALFPLATRTADFLPYRVGSDAQGDVAVAWTDDATGRVLFSERPAGGAFSVAAEVSTLGASILGDVQIDDAGTIHVFFISEAGTPSLARPRVATKPVGSGSWAVTPLAAANAADPSGSSIRGRVLGDGSAIAIWKQVHLADISQSKIGYVRRVAGSTTWTTKLDLPGGGGNTADYDLDLIGSGVAAVVFTKPFCANTVDIAFGATSTTNGAWSTAAQLSSCDPGGTRGEVDPPSVGLATDGTAAAAWSHFTASGYKLQVADHPAGVTPWAGPGFDEDLGLGGSPDLAVVPDGTATIGYTSQGSLWQRTRAAGSSTFAEKEQFFVPLGSLARLSMTPAADGSVLAAWMGEDDGDPRVAAAYRAPGAATFQSVRLAPDALSGYPVVARDDQGNGAAVWMHIDGTSKTLTASAFDVGAPSITDVAFPATATTGIAAPYGATVTDRWGTPTSGWAFGDTTTGPVSGTKAYTAAGMFTATLTASDTVGNLSSTSRSVTVTDPVPGGGGGGTGGGGGGTGGPGGADTTAPVLSKVSLSRATFRVDRKGASVSLAGKGTTIRYTLSEAARLRVTLRRLVTGRRVGTACRATSRTNRARKRCTRRVAAGTFSKASAAGTSRLAFAGRIKGKSLAVGRYEMTLVATDAAGNVSRPATVKLRVVRR